MNGVENFTLRITDLGFSCYSGKQVINDRVITPQNNCRDNKRN